MDELEQAMTLDDWREHVEHLAAHGIDESCLWDVRCKSYRGRLGAIKRERKELVRKHQHLIRTIVNALKKHAD